ncbi:hypothetical protein CFIO01_00279 [Colletotrichum fioriniae PJ7]|uniref:Uncharacterized protein n=1 Tax=Colletotrichum fioriniae PJ7 TaxID=1445577 RepID=A0A010RK86_9PEZI|nr:hypothetical protein CFIO01_00279 [Colletotrichum fioriniae PJ7]
MPRPLTFTRTLSEKPKAQVEAVYLQIHSPGLGHIISHPSVASTLHLIFPSKPEKLRYPRRALRPLSLSSANCNSNHPHSSTYRRPATLRLPTKLYLVDFWGGVLSRPIPSSLPPDRFLPLGRPVTYSAPKSPIAPSGLAQLYSSSHPVDRVEFVSTFEPATAQFRGEPPTITDIAPSPARHRHRQLSSSAVAPPAAIIAEPSTPCRR